MPPSGKKIEAMFDVRPTNESGFFDLVRFENIDKTINLRQPKVESFLTTAPKRVYKRPEAKLVSQPEEDSTQVEADKEADFLPSTESAAIVPEYNLMTPIPFVDGATEQESHVMNLEETAVIPESHSLDLRQSLLGELENIISSPIDIHAELARVGGAVLEQPATRRRTVATTRPILEVAIEQDKPQVAITPQVTLARSQMIPVMDYHDLLRQVGARPERNIDPDFWHRKPRPERVPLDFKRFIPKRGSFSSKWLVVIGVTVFGSALLLSSGKNNVENNVVANGKNAVENVMIAKQQLEESKFVEAANSFALAYDDFSRANNTLGRIGASFSWLLQYIPGLNKISAANNIVLAGQNMAKVGEDMSIFLESVSKIHLGDILNPQTNKDKSFHELFKQFQVVSASSKSRVEKTQKLLAHINPTVLPEDKRQLFDLFKEQLPQLAELLNKSSSYSDTLLSLVPEKGSKKYLVLFQNNSELRATGGFPGSYALVSVDEGRLSSIKIDDIYNPDGQLKNKIIPPKPLQHITSTWGARDANWFADFPTSAKKIIEYYREGSGESVDGIVTMTPDIIEDILKLTGSIPMPEYKLTLGADNFRTQVQEEVEYGERKPGQTTPKKILIDFFPRFLEQLSEQDKNTWLAIAGIFSNALHEKHVLAYFSDQNLGTMVSENGFAGALDDKAKDYLQVVFTNVKGSKTDHMTDSSLKLFAKLEDNQSVEHELKITRRHRGGDSSLRFYNLQNPSYVRVYVPQGAELEFIDGYDIPDFQPLVDYNDGTYKKDPDLERIESDSTHPYTGVDVFEESGRQVFGFWIILDPKDTKTVTLRYKVKDSYEGGDYRLLVQKQSGTLSDPLEVNIELPNGEHSNLKTDLRVDREIKIKID